MSEAPSNGASTPCRERWRIREVPEARTLLSRGHLAAVHMWKRKVCLRNLLRLLGRAEQNGGNRNEASGIPSAEA